MRNGILAGAIILALPVCGFTTIFAQQQDRTAPPNISSPVTVPPSRVAPSNTPAIGTEPINYGNSNAREEIPAWNGGGRATQPQNQPQPQSQPQLVRQPGNNPANQNPYGQNPNNGANPGGMRVYDVPNTAGGVPEGYTRGPNPARDNNPGNNPGRELGNIRPVATQPQVPFVLTPEEERSLDNFLQVWEQYSAKIKYFSTQFDCKKYVMPTDGTATQANPHVLKLTQYGDFQYEAPNKLLFRLAGEWNGEKQVEYKDIKGEKFLCDGTAYYRFDSTAGTDGKKVVEKTPLPKEMLQTGAISGPLPMIFGAKANDMKARYFLRLVTPQNIAEEQVWLEARPKWPEDAAEFFSITLILDRKTFLVKAMKKTHSNTLKDYDVFVFVDPKANSTGPPSSGPIAGLFGNKDPFNYETHARGYTLFVNDALLNTQTAGVNQPGPGFSPPPVGPNQGPSSIQATKPNENNINPRPPVTDYPRQPETGRINLYDNTGNPGNPGNNSGARNPTPIRM